MHTPHHGDDRLGRAIAAHAAFLASGEKSPAEWLARHDDLRDLLEPMLASDHDRTDDVARAPGIDGEAPATGVHEASLGGFVLRRELGRGAMGVVYEAEQVSLGRTVALKVLPIGADLDPRAVARFQREARLAGAMDHPGITKVYGCGRDDGRHWFAMELVRGLSLAEALTRLRVLGGDVDPFTVVSEAATGSARSRRDAAVAIAIQIADALACAHAAGVVHRDVKPGNILLGRDGTAKLSDFGIARSDEAVGLTRSGDFAGTPSYASPEQLRAKPGAIDHRTDVFSLGATLYEALTLQRPFDAATVGEVRLQIERHDPCPPSALAAGISRDLDAIVLRSLEKAPAARYLSASAFADDLRRWRNGRPVAARTVGRWIRGVRWCRRNPIAAALLATAAVALAVVTTLSLLLRSEREVAVQRLVQFRAMKVGRDLRLLREVLDTAPGPGPEHLPALRKIVAMADQLQGELPTLRSVLASLRQQGAQGGEVAPGRLITPHPAAAALEQLTIDRYGLAEWLEQMIGEKKVTAAWADSVRLRLRSMDEQREELARRIAARRLWHFDDGEVEYLHDSVEDQVIEIEWLGDHGISALRQRATRAAEHAAAPAGGEDSAWQSTQATAATLPAYRGLRLPVVPGLTPLGVDRHSGLLEFAHRDSGVVPVRDDNGALQLDANSAIVLVLIPGGRSHIGSQPDDESSPNFDRESEENEWPVQTIEISPFLLAKHELSHAQWLRLADGIEVHHQAARYEARSGFEEKPIMRVTWSDAERLCRANGLILPFETQWEHACRAGRATPWWCGGDPGELGRCENVRTEAEPGGRVSVYQGRANPFGLVHMHGNLAEWCADPFVELDARIHPGDGHRSGTAEGRQRVVRGGSYLYPATHARSAMRNNVYLHDMKNTIGVRPAMALPAL